MLCLLDSRILFRPLHVFAMPKLFNGINVAKQLFPCVSIWSLVSGVCVAWACALVWIRSQLFAHFNAHVGKFVLELSANGQILCLARCRLILDRRSRKGAQSKHSRLHCNETEKTTKKVS